MDQQQEFSSVEEEIFYFGKKLQNKEEFEYFQNLLNKEQVPLSQNVNKLLFSPIKTIILDNYYEINNYEINNCKDEEFIVILPNLDQFLNLNEKLLNLKQIVNFIQNEFIKNEQKYLNYLQINTNDTFKEIKISSFLLRIIINEINIYLQNWINNNLFNFNQFILQYGNFTCFEFLPKMEGDNYLLEYLLNFYFKKEYNLCLQIGLTYLERTLGDLLLLEYVRKKEHSSDNTLQNNLQKNNCDNSCDIDNTLQNINCDNSCDNFLQNECVNYSSRELKINELLQTQEISTILNKEILFILKLFTGPLQGLNLRNLIWHGFLNNLTNEFTNFFIFLILTISKEGNVINILNLGKFIRRKLEKIIFSTNLEINLQNGNLYKHEIIPFFRKNNINLFLENNYLISKRNLQDLKLSFHYILNENNYFIGLSILFPNLEHLLRKCFTIKNKCVNRLYSAESDKVYTTFDEILHPSINNIPLKAIGGGFLNVTNNIPNKEDKNEESIWRYEDRNKLFDELGEDLILQLFDILFFKNGPRIRDKLSHGVLCPIYFNNHYKELTEHVLSIVLSLLFKFNLLFNNNLINSLENRNNESTNMEELFNFLNKISSGFNFPIFHPQTQLLKDLQNSLFNFKIFYEETIIKIFKYQNEIEITKYLFIKYKMEKGEKRSIINMENDLILILNYFNNILKIEFNYESIVYNDLLNHSNNNLLNNNNYYKELNIENCLNKLNKYSNTCLKPKYPKTFCGKVGNTNSIEFTKIIKLIDIINHCNEMFISFNEIFKEIEESVLSRKGYARQRKQFVKLSKTAIDIYYQYLTFIVMIEYFYFSEINDKTLKERNIVLRLAKCLPANLKTLSLDKIAKLNDELKNCIN
ncbi:hypothetical protein ABK040_002506 [Willaertia magna]